MKKGRTLTSRPRQHQPLETVSGPPSPQPPSTHGEGHQQEQEQTSHQALGGSRTEAEWQANQLDRIFEALGDALIVYDADGNLVRMNAATRRILGLDAAPPDYSRLPVHERHALFDRRDAQGRPLAPEDLPMMRALRGEVLTGVQAVEGRMRTLDGREVETTTSAVPLRDHEGRIVGAVGILRDHTELNQLAREREEAQANLLAIREVNERLDTFFRIATHELRAPVASSQLAIQLAQRQVRRAASGTGQADSQPTSVFAQVATALQTTGQKLDHLWGLLQQLMDVSQARAGVLVLDKQLQPLGALVSASVEEQRLLAPSRTITVDLPASVPVMVMADGNRLGQVVTNYVTNALRYAPDSELIEVTVCIADGMGRVEVRDRGPGIAPEEHEAIWERFQRARSVTESHGLGLGLYIARMVVERHGGQVGVESQLGRGSTFWFTLPLASASG